MTGDPIRTIREALNEQYADALNPCYPQAAMAALTDVEQQLAAWRENAHVAQAAADAAEAALAEAREELAFGEATARWRAAERRANDLADALRAILELPGPQRHAKAHAVARAALDRQEQA